LLLAAGLFFRHPGRIELPADRRGLMRVAGEIRGAASEQPRVIYVYGEPALFFQLRAAGEELAVPIQDVPQTAAALDGQSAATFLVAGPHAQRDSQFQEQLKKGTDRWRLVQSYDYAPSSLVWLDLHDPRQPASHQAGSENAFRLYRFQPETP
jgi:dolichyl-phosphate-mannose-protein mannosyltransferase